MERGGRAFGFRRALAVATGLVAALALSGCGNFFGTTQEDKPLPGVRISVLSLDRSLEPDERLADVAVILPRPQPAESWPQQGGVPSHANQHLAAPGKLVRLWQQDIGDGADSDRRLFTQPVIADGVVYAIDTEALVTAWNADTGAPVWRHKLESRNENDDEGSLGGGLAVVGGRVFVTTGFATLFALDAKTGKEIWRRHLSGPMRAGPTVAGGRVFAVTIANELHALDADTGEELWSHAGITESAGLLGGASPAVEGGVVVVPYSSGELFALRVENGRVAWSESLTPLRRTNPVASLAHIRGLPVIDRGLVFAISHSGRMLAIDLRSGNRIWERAIAGTQAPWVAGDFVYVLSVDAELVCLSRRDGRIKWVRQLQRYEDEEDKEDPIVWAGPVLVGDRLIVAGTNDEVWSISPYTGKFLGRIEFDDPVRIAPSVAKGTLYFLTDDAELIALR